MAEQRVGDDEIAGAAFGAQACGAADLKRDVGVDAFRSRVLARDLDQIGAHIRRDDGAAKAGRGGEPPRHDARAAADLDHTGDGL